MQWTEAERLAWQYPPDITVSQWAGKYRHLAKGVTPEPGLWSNARTPYLAGLMDAWVEPGVEEIVFIKPTQVGGSEAARNVVGYCIDHDPGPLLWVCPDEKSAREAVKERIKPLIESSPRLARHLTDRVWDVNSLHVKLDTMDIYVAWAGSPQTLASRPIRYLILDEVDKYPVWSGREADPVSLAVERTQTFRHRRRVLYISTPTTKNGAIWRLWEDCGQHRYFNLPCPVCGRYQRIVFPRVRWDKPARIEHRAAFAEQLEREQLARYECEQCKSQITDTQRLASLEGGRWAATGQLVGRGGELLTPHLPSKRVGFHLSSLYSPWRGYSAVAAEFIKINGDPQKTMNFYNSWLGEPFEVQVATSRPSVIRDKALSSKAPEPLTVPPWAQILIATADTQRDHFYFVVRAWGYNYRSAMVHRGICNSFDELYQWTIQTPYRVGSSDRYATAAMLLIDSGGGTTETIGQSRTTEVYQFCLRNPQQLFPIKGSSRRLDFIVSFHWQKDHGVQLWEIDTDQAKDLLSRLVNDPDETRWMPSRNVDEDYCTQMASEHKILDPKTKKMTWVPKTSGAPNHWWDTEVYQAAAAMYVGAGQPQPAGATDPTPPPPPQIMQPTGGFVRGNSIEPNQSNWATGGGGGWWSKR